MNTAKLRAVVVDDERRNREGLKEKLRQRDVIVVGEAESGAKALDLIGSLAEAGGVDVAFLDIRMESDEAGLVLGKAMKSLPNRPRLVFVTAFPEHEKQTWPCHPDYFLCKPVDETELEEALNRVKTEVSRNKPLSPPTLPKRLALDHTLEKGSGAKTTVTQFVPTTEILFFRMIPKGVPKGGTLEAHLTGQRCVAGIRQVTLGQLESGLVAFGFFSPHKSFLVNLLHIDCLKPGVNEGSYRISIRGSEIELPVAREKLKALIQSLEKMV